MSKIEECINYGSNFGETIFIPLFRHWVPAFLMLNNSKFGIILLCLKDQLCAIAGVARNSAC